MCTGPKFHQEHLQLYNQKPDPGAFRGFQGTSVFFFLSVPVLFIFFLPLSLIPSKYLAVHLWVIGGKSWIESVIGWITAGEGNDGEGLLEVVLI